MTAATRPALALLLLLLAASGVLLGGSPARAHKPGDLIVTEGLVCDRASEVDAVVTLSLHGHDVSSALAEVNRGAQKPRCLVGVLVLTEFVATVQTFYHRDRAYLVHKVRVVGVALVTPAGLLPQRLAVPLDQFVVSTIKAAGA